MNIKYERKIISEVLQVLIFYVISIIIYLIILGIYARFVVRPMFFPISCIFALIVPTILYFSCRNFWLRLHECITRILMVFSSMLIILIFSVFGPTFIDRSISYHLAFIAVEQGSVSKQDLESSGYVQMVFDKRYEDAMASGFITFTDEVGVYVPTMKAKIMYEIMRPIGILTGSMDEYKNLLNIIDKEKNINKSYFTK